MGNIHLKQVVDNFVLRTSELFCHHSRNAFTDISKAFSTLCYNERILNKLKTSLRENRHTSVRLSLSSDFLRKISEDSYIIK